MRRSGRLNIAALAAIASIGLSGSAAIQEMQAQPVPVPSPVGMGKTTGSPNRRAPGAHKPAHRAAMKLRRVKKHKARCK